MANTIKDTLSARLHITITPDLAKNIIRYVLSYETYGTNINAFASPYLGIDSCIFREADRAGFFDLFDVGDHEVAGIIQRKISGKNIFGIAVKSLIDNLVPYISVFSKDLTVAGFSQIEMKRIINDIPAIDPNFKIASDPFNILCVWVTHLILVSDLPDKLKQDASLAVLRFLQYRFFTSIVNYRFKYKPNEEAMRTTFESLSDKFDIKRYGTWKAVIDARAADFLSPQSVHYKALMTGTDDKAFLYIITDLQSRMRSQINLYTEEFMRIKESGDIIGSYGSTGTDKEDGTKVMLVNESGLDIAISSVYQDTMSVSRLLDDKAIRLTAGLFTALRPDQIRQMMLAFSEYCVKLAKTKDDDKVSVIGDEELYVGGHVLIQQIIQQTYRYCRNTGTNIKLPVAVLKTTKDVYSSSRVSDSGIITVKSSVGNLVLELQASRRETTLSALRVAFIIYIMLLAVKYIR